MAIAAGEAPPAEDLAGPEDRLDEDPEGLELGAEIADRPDQTATAAKTRSQSAAIAAEDDIGHGVDLPHPGQQPQPFGDDPAQQTGGEAHRDADEQRGETHAVGQPRARR